MGSGGVVSGNVLMMKVDEAAMYSVVNSSLYLSLYGFHQPMAVAFIIYPDDVCHIYPSRLHTCLICYELLSNSKSRAVPGQVCDRGHYINHLFCSTLHIFWFYALEICIDVKSVRTGIADQRDPVALGHFNGE
jgi:hypothetical protein